LLVFYAAIASREPSAASTTPLASHINRLTWWQLELGAEAFPVLRVPQLIKLQFY
jgi:hypothetical protein